MTGAPATPEHPLSSKKKHSDPLRELTDGETRRLIYEAMRVKSGEVDVLSIEGTRDKLRIRAYVKA